jgi:hypothetical protein
MFEPSIIIAYRGAKLVTVLIDRHLTYARLLRALYIRLSFSPFFLYISIV